MAGPFAAEGGGVVVAVFVFRRLDSSSTMYGAAGVGELALVREDGTRIGR
jgi:hypothetical protein